MLVEIRRKVMKDLKVKKSYFKRIVVTKLKEKIREGWVVFAKYLLALLFQSIRHSLL